MKQFKKTILASVALVSSLQNYAVDAIKLKISGNNYSDETVIRFINDATNGFDNNYDAQKLFSPNHQVPAIYTKIDSTYSLVINSYPLLTSGINAGIYVRNYVATTYTISPSEFGSIPPGVCIYLEDVGTGNYYNMRNGMSYSFFLPVDSVVQQPRFVLHFTVPATINTISASCEISNNGSISISKTGDDLWNYQLLDAQGNSIKADSNINSTASISHLFSGIYNLEIYTPSGCSENFSVYVPIENSLQAPIASSASFCEGDITTSLTASGTNVKWYSDMTLNTNISTGNTYSIGALSTGTYVYYVAQADTNGCQSSATQVDLIINNLPGASIVNNQSICEGAFIPALTATGNNIKWYCDSTLTTQISTGNTYNINQTTPGTYQYYVTQTDGNGCISSPTMAEVSIHPLPSVSFAGINNQYLVNDDAVLLTGIPAGGIFNGPGVSGNQFIPFLAGTGGPYEITYLYSDNKGCTNTATALVTVKQNTGIASLSNETELNLFPNPANEQTVINLKLKNESKTEIEIYDISGKSITIMEPKHMEAGSFTIEIDRNTLHLSSGMYWIKVKTEKEQKVAKIIFQ